MSDGPTGGRTDRPTDRLTDVQTHAPIDLSHYDTIVKGYFCRRSRHAPIDLSHYDTIVKGYFCRLSSTGSISQSECLDFGYGPITVAICLATSGEIENLPLKVMNHDMPKIRIKRICGDLSGNMN